MDGVLIRCGLWVALGMTALFAEAAVQPLFEALRQGDVAKVKAAVENDADLKIRDAYGNTLLMQAAVYGRADDLAFLLTHGADANAANNAGHTALMRALPDLTKIKLLVERGASVNAATEDGTTVLIMAAHIRSAEDVVRYLIQKGADMRATNNRGLDALMSAAQQGASGNLKILLDAGASVSARAKIVLDDSARFRVLALDPTVLERVKRRAEGITALMSAVRAGCEACVRMLLDHGADAKAKTEGGLTALHGAAYKGEPVMVSLLLEAGAPVNVADDRGFTPLMMAVNSRTKSAKVVRMLLDRGADVKAKDTSGRCVAEWAQIGARGKIMKMVQAPPAVEKAVQAKVTETEAGRQRIRAAAEKSVALLEESGAKFFPKSGCISCHNVSIPMIAIHEAAQRSYPVHAATRQMTKQTTAMMAPFRENLLSGYCTLPGIVTTGSYALMSVHGEGYAPDPWTDGIIRCLATEQHPDGHWGNAGDQRPPLSPESAIPGTALSARAVKLYPVPALARELDADVARARAYLLSAKPEGGDDYAFRLLGLFWTEARQDQIAAAARELVAQQRPDGGWAQTPDMTADAYSTGQALTALAIAQPSSVNTQAYRRGVSYLMQTREADGSWHVRSRAFGFQPYFESGFPHGPDQWISMAATAWAAMALMPAAEPEHVALR